MSNERSEKPAELLLAEAIRKGCATPGARESREVFLIERNEGGLAADVLGLALIGRYGPESVLQERDRCVADPQEFCTAFASMFGVTPELVESVMRLFAAEDCRATDIADWLEKNNPEKPGRR